MAFQYAAGVAGSIAAWFAIFQNMIILAGWTVEQGGGTTDMIIRTLGPDRAYTMAYARVWNWVGNAIRAEVQNDLAGTQVTNEISQLQAGAGNFNYWMNANDEFINIIFNNPVPQWSSIHFGVLLNFALLPTDETYKMTTSNGLFNTSILRNHDNVWDVDITNFDEPQANVIRLCPVDGSFSPMGIMANDGSEIAGQLQNVTGQLDNTIATGTQFTTLGEGARNTTWIVGQDWFNNRMAIRTGGVKPIGISDGSFTFAEGVTTGPQDFIETVLPAILVPLGWQNLGDPGIHTFARLFYSTGESGTDEIYIIVAWLQGANDHWYLHVQDDAVGTNRTTGIFTLADQNQFPTRFYVAADRDCVAFSAGGSALVDNPNWLGKVVPHSQGMDTEYFMCTYAPYQNGRRILRDHDGNWDQIPAFEDAAAVLAGSSPNDFDGLTCIGWPRYIMDPLAAGGRCLVGQMKYIYSIDGCLNPGDEVPVEDRNYYVFNGSNDGYWLLRAA